MTDKIELFRKIIGNITPIKNLGFILSEQVEPKSHPILGNNYDVDLVSANRTLSFSLNLTYKSRTAVSLHLINNQSGGIITLFDWMDLNGYDSEKDYFRWPNSEQFEIKLSELAECLTRLLKNEKLYKIISGEEWENVPFSWFGQR